MRYKPLLYHCLLRQWSARSTEQQKWIVQNEAARYAHTSRKCRRLSATAAIGDEGEVRDIENEREVQERAATKWDTSGSTALVDQTEHEAATLLTDPAVVANSE